MAALGAGAGGDRAAAGLAAVGARLLWVAQEALRDRGPFGGFPWGRLAFARPTRRWPGWPRSAGRRWSRFAVALPAALLAALAWRLAGGPPAAAGRRAARPVGRGWPRCVVAWPAPALAAGDWQTTTGPHGHGRGRAGQRAAARPGLQRPAPGGAATTTSPRRSRWPTDARPAGPPSPTWWSGRRTPATSTRCATRTPRARSTAAARAIGAPILVGALLTGRPARTSRATPASSGTRAPGPGGAAYVKRHPVPFAEYMPLRPIARLVSRRGRPGPAATSSRGDRPGVLHRRPGHGRRRDLLRGRLRRAGPGHRRRRRAAARGADQQRHVRRGRGAAAAGHGAAAGGRARPGRR